MANTRARASPARSTEISAEGVHKPVNGEGVSVAIFIAGKMGRGAWKQDMGVG